MITQLTAEMQDEIKHKDYCVDEFNNKPGAELEQMTIGFLFFQTSSACLILASKQSEDDEERLRK